MCSLPIEVQKKLSSNIGELMDKTYKSLVSNNRSITFLCPAKNLYCTDLEHRCHDCPLKNHFNDGVLVAKEENKFMGIRKENIKDTARSIVRFLTIFFIFWK